MVLDFLLYIAAMQMFSAEKILANWKYSIRQDGDMLIADIGPKGAAPPPIKIVMRAADLKIMKAVKA